MNVRDALLAGAAGAATLNFIHETVRQFRRDAPRMDIIGERALARTLRLTGTEPPDQDTLYVLTLLGDFTSNALYYSLVGAGSHRGAWWRGALLGVGAGVGAVVLAPRLGLGRAPVQRSPATAVMTVLWYTAGGLAAAAVARRLAKRSEAHEDEQQAKR